MDVGTKSKVERFVKLVERWFETGGRSFPWRKTKNPYFIIIAEILLKKTRAEVVRDFFEFFVNKYPSFHALAEAKVSELETALLPLGLYKQRAKHLKELAVTIIEHYKGALPRTADKLKNLPGVGEYSANAILCFAFEKRVPIVDTNVVRVLTRVFGVKTSRSEARRSPELWRLADQIVKASRDPKVVNWAMIDLGALICKPFQPDCSSCPLKAICNYKRDRVQE